MTDWIASRLAAAQIAVVAVESITERGFTVKLREWKMTICIKAPWYIAWLIRWRARRVARKAILAINVPIEVKTTWETPQ